MAADLLSRGGEGKYPRGGPSLVLEESCGPGEAPGPAFLESGHKCVAAFVPISARLAMCPEARTPIEKFEPGVRQWLPVEIARRRGKQPIRRLDGRVLDTPHHVLVPQVWLDAVWVGRSEVSVSATRHGPPVVSWFGSDNTVPRREVVQGHHFWRGGFHPPNCTSFPGVLVRAAEARKPRKLRFTRPEEA